MFTRSENVACEPFSFGVGPTVSNSWFDQGTDNDSVMDDADTLDAFWHFDHTTDVEAPTTRCGSLLREQEEKKQEIEAVRQMLTNSARNADFAIAKIFFQRRTQRSS